MKIKNIQEKPHLVHTNVRKICGRSRQGNDGNNSVQAFPQNHELKIIPCNGRFSLPKKSNKPNGTRKRADLKNARISNRRRRRRALALFSSCAPPLPRRHVNRMKRLLEATLTPAIKPETLLCYNKTGSRTRRPIQMGYESSAVEIRVTRRGLLTWWNKRSPVKMDESS